MRQPGRERALGAALGLALALANPVMGFAAQGHHGQAVAGPSHGAILLLLRGRGQQLRARPPTPRLPVRTPPVSRCRPQIIQDHRTGPTLLHRCRGRSVHPGIHRAAQDPSRSTSKAVVAVDGSPDGATPKGSRRAVRDPGSRPPPSAAVFYEAHAPPGATPDVARLRS